MDRHIWQRFATVVLTALAIFSINILSPVGNDDGFGITTTQARRRAHQLPNLLDQQIVILVGLDIDPNWVRGQSTASSLIRGIVKPDSTVPARIDKDHSYLVTSDRNKEISLFFRADKKKIAVKYTNHGGRLYTKTVPLSRLVEQSYRTKKQRQQMNKYVSALRTE